VLLLAGYGAGLATGLAHFGGPGLAVVLGLGLYAGRRHLFAVALAAALAGLIAGWTAAQVERRSCPSRLRAGPLRSVVVLDEPVYPDAPVARALPDPPWCGGPVSVRWPTGARQDAGDRLAVEGRWIPRPGSWRADGILVVKQYRPAGSRPRIRHRLRNWLAATTRRLYGSRTGTVEALVVNRRGAMPPELRVRYARAGLVHILSISGFHVGVIVAWITLALARLLPPGRRQLWAVLGAIPYILLLDWPAPAARALLLALVVAVERVRQRSVEPVSLLAITCLLVLVLDPWALVDPGAWLSALALFGAMTLVRWSDRALGSSWWWRTGFGSVGATLATAPVTAALFGTVSMAGIGLNFVAIPLAAVAVPGVLLSLLAAPVWPWLAHRLAGGAGLLLAGLDQLAWWGGSIPAASVEQPMAWTSAVPWAAVLGLLWYGVAGGTTFRVAARRWALGAALASWTLVVAGLGRREAHGVSELALHFVDVGQGDAAVIRTPGGHWVEVDAGPRDDTRDAGRQIVAPYLARQGAARLSVLVVSHAHADHIGGAVAVLERFGAAAAIEPAELVADPLYTEFLDRLEADAVRWQPARPGLRFELDGVRFSVLHPDTLWSEWRADLNEDSAVLLVEYGAFRAALMGDAGILAESRLAGRVGRVAVLKTGHHGSRSATGDAWLRELSPRIGVISVGRGNRYGHPHAEVLERLARHGVSVWRTDEVGTVVVTTDGRTVVVRGRGAEERFALPERPDSIRIKERP
jgi:competence protein ComEC